MRITENEGVTIKSNSLFSLGAFSKTAQKRLKTHTSNSDFTRTLYALLSTEKQNAHPRCKTKDGRLEDCYSLVLLFCTRCNEGFCNFRVPLGSSPIQRSPSIVVCLIDISPCRNEGLCNFRVTPPSSPIQRSPSIVVSLIDISPCRNEDLCNFRVPLTSSPMQRSQSIVVCLIDISTSRNEGLCNFREPLVSSLEQLANIRCCLFLSFCSFRIFFLCYMRHCIVHRSLLNGHLSFAAWEANLSPPPFFCVWQGVAFLYHSLFLDVNPFLA